MAEWQYQVHRFSLDEGGDFDEQIQATLTEFGAKGWELVEVLEPKDGTKEYRLIFKTAKPLHY